MQVVSFLHRHPALFGMTLQDRLAEHDLLVAFGKGREEGRGVEIAGRDINASVCVGPIKPVPVMATPMSYMR
jgi:hypothetical protein